MITNIAYELIKDISTRISYIDKWAGLVVPMKQNIAGIVKVIPVAIQTPTTCDVSDYMDLVPDSTKMSICYCEKLGEPMLEPRAGFFISTQNLRIILWYNLNRMTAGQYLDEGVITANIISQIPKVLSNSLFTNVKNVRISVISNSSGADLFNKYTYNEVKDQFVTFPYGAISVDVSAMYTLSLCDAILDPTVGCEAGAGNHTDYIMQELTIYSANTFTVPEFTLPVGKVQAGMNATYAILGGVDWDKFTINSTLGLLSFKTLPDYDIPIDSDGNNVYHLTVEATKNGATATQNITVNVTDIPILSCCEWTMGEKITGIDSGILGMRSFTDDYEYLCVQGGIAGVAIWKKKSLTQSI
jgi:hypothetical protein